MIIQSLEESTQYSDSNKCNRRNIDFALIYTQPCSERERKNIPGQLSRLRKADGTAATGLLARNLGDANKRNADDEVGSDVSSNVSMDEERRQEEALIEFTAAERKTRRRERRRKRALRQQKESGADAQDLTEEQITGFE